MLLAVCKATGKDFSCIPTIAKGFSVGMGGLGEVCGAEAGGILTLGLLYGQDMSIGGKARDFANRFTEQNGALRCKDLLGFDGDGVDNLVAFAKNHKSDVCDDLVKSSVEILLELIEEQALVDAS